MASKWIPVPDAACGSLAGEEISSQDSPPIKRAKFSASLSAKGRVFSRHSPKDIASSKSPNGEGGISYAVPAGTQGSSWSALGNRNSSSSNLSKHVYTSELLSEIMKAVTNGSRMGPSRGEPMRIKPTVESVMHFIKLSGAVHLRRMKHDCSSSRSGNRGRKDSPRSVNRLMKELYVKASAEPSFSAPRKDRRFRYIPDSLCVGAEQNAFHTAFVINLHRDGWFIGDSAEDSHISQPHASQRMHPYDIPSIAFLDDIDNHRMPPYLVDILDMLPERLVSEV